MSGKLSLLLDLQYYCQMLTRVPSLVYSSFRAQDPVASILHTRGNSTVKVKIECPDNLMVRGDRMRLKQIILNLSANASKFVDRGYICLRAEVVNGSVQLSVEDSGPGIPPEKRQRLFFKFQESLDSLNQGTGIGLAGTLRESLLKVPFYCTSCTHDITHVLLLFLLPFPHLLVCKNLSELMGADLWLDETFESGVEGCVGTRFVLQLNQPAMAEERSYEDSPENKGDEEVALLKNTNDLARKATEGAQTDGSFSLPQNLSVLFTDDDTILRKMFSRSLKRVAPEWEICEASNGETALRLTETKKFDLIFMDQYVSCGVSRVAESLIVSHRLTCCLQDYRWPVLRSNC